MNTPDQNHGTLLATDLPAERRSTAIYISGFCLVLLFLLRAPFHSGVFWMKYFQDDFFYYLKVAQNIADGKGSTFNGIAPTNGYHPLYEALLVLLSHFTRSPHGILLFQAILIFVASLATLLLSITLLRYLGVTLLNAAAFSAWVTIYSLRIYYDGMEITLTIPLALAFVIVVTRLHWWLGRVWPSVCLGLLGSAMVLSRLDSLLLIVMLFAAMLCLRDVHSQVRLENWRQSAVGIVIGLAPVLAYFAWNRPTFGGFLPVSAEAKQLKTGVAPSIQTWAGLYLNRPAYLAVAAPIFIAILAAPFLLRRFSPMQRSVLVTLLLFPWVFFLLVSIRSDWPLWPWYLYPLRLATLAALALLASWPPLTSLLRTRMVAVTLAVACFLPLFVDGWRIQLPGLYDRAQVIAAFAQTHRGVYAMGDGAGAVGYLLHDPVVQLEGLMMDRHYLDLLRRRTPLPQILREYQVNYYVGTYATRNAAHPDASSSPDVPACFAAEEPLLAGPGSPKSRGLICQPALLHTGDPETGVQTVVYRIGSR